MGTGAKGDHGRFEETGRVADGATLFSRQESAMS